MPIRKSEESKGGPLCPDNPCSVLKGVGARKAQALNGLGIRSVSDLVMHLPRSYWDFTEVRTLSQCTVGEKINLVCTVEAVKGQFIPGRRLYCIRVKISDPTGVGEARWYSGYTRKPPTWMTGRFKQGTNLALHGKVVKIAKTGPVLANPRTVDLGSGTPDSEEQTLPPRPVTPVYSLCAGIKLNQLTKWIVQAVDGLPADISDGCEEWGQPPGAFRSCLQGIHNPSSLPQAEAARKRLAMNELFALQLVLALRRSRSQKLSAPTFEAGLAEAERLLAGLPYRLTSEQVKVWEEIGSDLVCGRPMNRLLQGDVGSGKTVISALACISAAGSGYQSVFLAPTDVLARQQYASLSKFLGPFGYTVGLVAASEPKAKRRDIINGIAAGDINVAVGTHALLEDTVVFSRLGLAVTDEQHRFGVRQRETLAKKGEGVHTLVMSATPVPRSLALTLYGDLDISTILERPPGREPIDTKWLPFAKLEQAYAFVGKTVMSGGRAYVICPQVVGEDSDADDEYDGDEEGSRIRDISVTAQHSLITELLKDKICPDSIGLLHGKLKPEQKNRMMDRFAAGDVSVLVSTTVVEVGVDVPEANLIVIVGAERFGLAQLHQLRGRVGRGSRKSMCLLISDGDTEPAIARLEAMRASQDGFFLADKDLELRGPGEILGIRQHGLPELRLARLPEDLALLVEARKKAETLLSGKGEGELFERLKLASRWYPAANSAIWADES